jgi:hypothetical protein
MMISLSWLELKPNEDKHQNSEDFEEYFPRINSKEDYKHIPESVLEQWIHPHNHNWKTLANYAWLDYSKIRFESQEWTFEKLANIHVIKEFEEYVSTRASLSDFKNFLLYKTGEDLAYWKNEGTWKTPPIILDSESLKAPPPTWSEIVKPYQLVEGHTRLGHLHSMKKVSDLGKGKIAETHQIWLMREI